MPRPSVLKTYLPATGALSLAAVLAADLRSGFELLHPGAILLVLALSGILLAHASIRRPGSRPHGLPLRLAAGLGAATAAALAVNALALHAKEASLERRWPSSQEARLDERAERLRDHFASILDRMEEPIARARTLASRSPATGGPSNVSSAFDTLDLLVAGRPAEQTNLGVSIYRADGRALAWEGSCRPIPPQLLARSLPSGSTRWIVLNESGVSRVLALARPWQAQPLVVTSELIMRSIYDDRVAGDLLNPGGFNPDKDRIIFADYRRPPVDLEDLFETGGDILEVSGAVIPTVHVAMRAPDGSLLGHATLSGEPFRSVEARLFSRHRALGAWVITLAGLFLLGFVILPRPPTESFSVRREISRQGIRIALLWTFRLLLRGFPLPVSIAGQDLADPALFARGGMLGLFGSPLDFLLTSLTLLSTGVLISVAAARILTGVRKPRRVLAAASLAGSVAVAFAAGTYLPAEAYETVRNTMLEVLTVRPLDLAPARLVLQSAIVFSLTAFLIPLITLGWTAIWASAPHRSGGPPPPPSPTENTLRWLALLVVPSTVAACILFELSLQPAATAVLKRLLEDNLAPLVRAMPSLRRIELRDALDTVSSQPGLADRIETALPYPDPTLAHDLWSLTPFAIRGNASSLTVRDASGALVSRFSLNFPPTLDERSFEREHIPEGRVEEFVTGPQQRPVHALHAHSVIRKNGAVVGTITIHVRNDFGDLPPLTPLTPLQRGLKDTSPLSPLLPPWSSTVGMAVYSKEGVPVLAYPRDPPAPPPRGERVRLLSDWQEDLWRSSEIEGFPTHTYFFSSAGHLVALSFSDPSLLGRAARSIRLTLQSLVCLLLLVAPWGIASAFRLGWRPDPARIVFAATRTHYRRLLSSFLLASFVPLALLAFALTEFIRAEIREDVRERGWAVLESAKRQVEGLGVLSGVEGPPDDAALYSLTQEGGDDLALFVGSNLIGASNREMYDDGLLPLRLDGNIHRQILLEGRRVAQGTEIVSNRAYATIDGVVSLGVAGEGVLSVLLSADTPHEARRAQQVYDALLVTSASIVLVMGILAYGLARRIAAPIRRLSEAAARIASGDLNAEVAVMTRDETGDLIASFNAMARAIRHQHQDLEQRGNYIAKILLNATTGVLSVDLAGRIVTINPAAVSILAVPRLAAGQNLVARLSESEEFHSLVRTLRESLAQPASPKEIETEIGPKGEPRHARARILPFTEGGGLLIFLDDVTETIRSNRLLAWAEMARRIAHEIKNPLTPIQLSVDHIRRVYADKSASFPSVLEDCLQTIHEQVSNLRAISGQFSIYARHQEIKKEPTQMREFLSEAIRPYRLAPPEGIAVEVDLDGNLATMDVDRGMISQAIVNLVENSLQAMKDGGTLMFQAAMTGPADRQELQIVIADTGVGMDREALARAFEPYFSTKVTGTGLGMTIARRAVEEHKGRIELTSAPSQGTTARIVIPRG